MAKGTSTIEQITAVLSQLGPLYANDLAKRIGKSIHAVNCALWRTTKKNITQKTSNGAYELRDDAGDKLKTLRTRASPKQPVRRHKDSLVTVNLRIKDKTVSLSLREAADIYGQLNEVSALFNRS